MSTQSRVHLESTVCNYRAVVDGSRRAIESAVAAGMRYVEILGVEHEATGLGGAGRTGPPGATHCRVIAGSYRVPVSHSSSVEALFLEAYATFMHVDAERGRSLDQEFRWVCPHSSLSVPTDDALCGCDCNCPRRGPANRARRSDYVIDVIRRLRIGRRQMHRSHGPGRSESVRSDASKSNATA